MAITGQAEHRGELERRLHRAHGYWPLFSLLAENGDYIEFSARPVNLVTGFTPPGDPPPITIDGQFRIRYKAGSSTGTVDWPQLNVLTNTLRSAYWSRNSQLLVGISYEPPSSGQPGKIRAVASLGGGTPARILPDGIAITVGTPKRLVFHSADTQPEVVSFRWFGGEIKAEVLTELQMEAQFKSLAFLPTG